jgi:hypothetical protein
LSGDAGAVQTAATSSILHQRSATDIDRRIVAETDCVQIGRDNDLRIRVWIDHAAGRPGAVRITGPAPAARIAASRLSFHEH